jgi:spermidine synthase
MIPWVQLDTADVPDGGGTLRLMQRGQEFSIMAGAIELMNSRLSGSEEALASLACAAIAGRPAPVMLIGGMGMGFTLRAAQRALGPNSAVVVAELVPAVIAWARGPMAALHGDSLSDPRLTLHAGDIGPLIRIGNAARYDAILLDVDNGPDGLTRKANDGLYSAAGLLAAKRALRPGGVLAVWSAAPSAPFTQRLRAAGFAVETLSIRADGKPATKRGGARHVIWMATAPG